MYQPSCVFTSSIGYLGGPGGCTAMLVSSVGRISEWGVKIEAPKGVGRGCPPSPLGEPGRGLGRGL